MVYHRILVKPHGVYVKVGTFFDEQGGLTEEWGKNWKKINARNIDHARKIGIKLRHEEGEKKRWN